MGRSDEHNNIIDSVALDTNVNIKNIASDIKFLTFPEQITNADFEVYTDGSRMEDETGFSVCTFQNNQNIDNFLYKLKSHNSVFQAEMAAIRHAANWAAKNNYKINIHTDSLSSIMALKSAHSRSQFVNNSKKDLYLAKNLVGLSWVKAHVGIPGNEWADQQAKKAICSGEELDIPAPRSYLNRKVKAYIIHAWTEYWNRYNSASGIRVGMVRSHSIYTVLKNLTLRSASAYRWAMLTTIPFLARSPKITILRNPQTPINEPGFLTF
ncbi:hypothetical protein AVEN_13141-1 [Araneus ventricosus]|uniref:ribonuclease H n=1 Tax=Araneus ventricosus TaxID=182803 RepID=A0A4Y2H791_ARAVE|nr:hypothetical protein AVEN_13141-1 [Araneus ventricosus]